LADTQSDAQLAAKTESGFIFKMSWADVMRATMFGTIVTLSKDIIRVPLHFPGHTSLWWMGILVLGKGLIRKFGAGIVMGIVSGVLAVLLGLGGQGMLVFFKYFIPGLMLDLVAPLFQNKLELPAVGAICGATISLIKMVTNLILGLILNLHMTFLVVGLGFTSVSHAVFGAAGGAIAALLIKQLRSRLTNWD
jgi:hypothetical protein